MRGVSQAKESRSFQSGFNLLGLCRINHIPASFEIGIVPNHLGLSLNGFTIVASIGVGLMIINFVTIPDFDQIPSIFYGKTPKAYFLKLVFPLHFAAVNVLSPVNPPPLILT